MDTGFKVRENRLRRVAERRGLRLRKRRRVDSGALGYGRYRIEDRRGGVVAGYDWDLMAETMTLDDVEQYLMRTRGEPHDHRPDTDRG